MGVKHLWQKGAKTQGLELYYGFGGQLSPRLYQDRDVLGFGLTGVFGLEYFIADTPLSAFLDFGPYLELVRQLPGSTLIQPFLKGVRIN